MPLKNIKNTEANIENIVKICEINENSLFIDLGANLGQQIKYLDENNIRSIAFEPHPIIFTKLINSVKNLSNNITFYNKAAWIKNEKHNLFFKQGPEVINGGASLIMKKQML